jgi:hypothetical protein
MVLQTILQYVGAYIDPIGRLLPGSVVRGDLSPFGSVRLAGQSPENQGSVS